MDPILEKWIAALRSGEYKQGKGSLCTPEGKYCCLGVLEHVLEGGVEREKNGWAKVIPTATFLEKHGIDYSSGMLFGGYSMGELAEMNDLEGLTFEQIADKLEEGAK